VKKGKKGWAIDNVPSGQPPKLKQGVRGTSPGRERGSQGEGNVNGAPFALKKRSGNAERRLKGKSRTGAGRELGLGETRGRKWDKAQRVKTRGEKLAFREDNTQSNRRTKLEEVTWREKRNKQCPRLGGKRTYRGKTAVRESLQEGNVEKKTKKKKEDRNFRKKRRKGDSCQ